MKNLLERWKMLIAKKGGARSLVKSRRGMTLFEVMIVITIIVMVMGTLLFGVMSSFNDAKGATTEMAMGKVSSAIQIYTMRHKKPPTSSEGINKVFKHDAIPTDAWGNEFIYSSPGPNGAPFDLLSYGDDGAKGGGDDILWSAVKNR